MNRQIMILFFYVFLCGYLPVIGQRPKGNDEQTQIQIAHSLTLYSEILQENRRIWVHLPSSYQEGPGKGAVEYPVLFVLDARSHFTTMAAMSQQLGNEIFWPKQIVIGIESTDRFRDFTPSKINPTNQRPTQYFANSGGASDFLEFLISELIPFIESKYQASPYRSLVGHSLGGLFTTYALFSGSKAFRNFVAIDPSVWWDQNYLNRQIKAYRNCLQSEDASFYLATANSLPKGITPANVDNFKGERTAHFRAIKELNEILLRMGCDPEKFTYRYYENNSHANLSIPAFYDAFTTIFHFYNIDPVLKQFDPERLHNISTSKFLGAFRDHYRKISDHFGYVVHPEEDLIRSMGYKSLELEDYEKAEALFRLNISNYPESSGVYNTMGDFYYATHRPYRAEEYYMLSLSLNKDQSTIKKLKFIQHKN